MQIKKNIFFRPASALTFLALAALCVFTYIPASFSQNINTTPGTGGGAAGPGNGQGPGGGAGQGQAGSGSGGSSGGSGSGGSSGGSGSGGSSGGGGSGGSSGGSSSSSGGGSSSSGGGGCSPGIPCITLIDDPANLPKAEGKTCDADFMNQIYARSFLEAEREIAINSTVIRKPDSIMEYSCFDQQVSVTARNAGPLFSKTLRFKDTLVDVSTGLGLFGFAANSYVPLSGLEMGSAVDGLTSGSLSALLPKLSPDALVSTLKDTPLNVIQGLSPEALVAPLTNLSPVGLSTVLSGLPATTLGTIESKLTSAIPGNLTSLLNGATTLESKIVALQNLNTTDAASALSGLSATNVTGFLNILPKNVLGNFSASSLTSTFQSLAPSALGSLSSAALGALPTDVIKNTLSALNPSQLTTALNSFTSTAAALLPVSEISSVLQSLSPANITSVINNLGTSVLGALPKDALATTFQNLSPTQLVSTFNNLSSSALGALSPAVFSQTFSNFSPDAFASAFNNLTSSTLSAISPQSVTAMLSNFTSTNLSQALNGLSATVLQAIPTASIKNALNTLAPADLSAALSSLTPQALTNMNITTLTDAFNKLGSSGLLASTLQSFSPAALTALPVASLISSLTNSTSDILGSLTPDFQSIISNNISSFLPASITSAFGSGSALISNLKSLSPAALVAAIPGLSSIDTSLLLNIVPTDVINNITSGDLTKAFELAGFSSAQVAGIFSTFSSGVIAALPIGELSSIASKFNFKTDDVLKIFNNLSTDALKNISEKDLREILSLPDVDINNIVKSLGVNVSALNMNAFTDAILNKFDFDTLKDLSPEELFAFLNNIRPDALPEVLASLPPEVFELVANFTSSVALGNALAGLGGGLFGYGGFAWAPLDVYLDDTKLDQLLERVILNGLKDYVDTNFKHSFLGGAAPGLDGTVKNKITTSGRLSCDAMNQIWFIAKCRNFALDDQFLSFRDLTTLDPRQLPAACKEGPTITQALIDVAENKDALYAEKAEYLTFSDRLDPGVCTNPIPTGVLVKKIIYTTNDNGNVVNRDEVFYDERVCSNPGCYYNYESGACQ